MQKKHIILYAVILLLASLLLISQCMQRNRRLSDTITEIRKSVQDKEKQATLEELEAVYQKAWMHHGALEEMAIVIAGAEANLESLGYFTELVGTVPYHTQGLLNAAGAAAHAKIKLEEFKEIAELMVLKGSVTVILSDLAVQAAGMSINLPGSGPDLHCPFCMRGYTPPRDLIGGGHKIQCEGCHRAFLLILEKKWWGRKYQIMKI